MCPQIACLNRGKITLLAFEGFFSGVGFQMSPQITCLNRGKVTLVTSEGFVSKVDFQMSPQTAGLDMCKVTISTSVHHFSVFLCHTTLINFITRIKLFHSDEICWLTKLARRKLKLFVRETFTFLNLVNNNIVVWYWFGGKKVKVDLSSLSEVAYNIAMHCGKPLLPHI